MLHQRLSRGHGLTMCVALAAAFVLSAVANAERQDAAPANSSQVKQGQSIPQGTTQDLDQQRAAATVPGERQPARSTTAQLQEAAAEEDTKAPDAPEQESTEEVARLRQELAKSRQSESPWAWTRRMLEPIIKLGGIALILGIFFWAIDLPSVLKGDVWSERTIVAFAVVFTFCAASLLSLPDNVPTFLKDVALIVLGFYFGASKGSKEEQSSTGSQQQTQGVGEQAGGPATKQATQGGTDAGGNSATTGDTAGRQGTATMRGAADAGSTIGTVTDTGPQQGQTVSPQATQGTADGDGETSTGPDAAGR